MSRMPCANRLNDFHELNKIGGVNDRKKNLGHCGFKREAHRLQTAGFDESTFSTASSK